MNIEKESSNSEVSDFNTEYGSRISDLIPDIFYSNCSTSSKLALTRVFTEIMVRWIFENADDHVKPKLSYPYKNHLLMLGNDAVKKDLKVIDIYDFNLESHVTALNKICKDYNHSEKKDSPSEDTIQECFKHIDQLYAFLFIQYFKKFTFGRTPLVMSCFSLLPQKIRYIVLEFLYRDEVDNIALIDKLALIYIKHLGIEKAHQWLESQKAHLEKFSCIAEDLKEKQYGEAIYKVIEDRAPENMYILCKEKIKNMNQTIKDNNGLPYTTFEESQQFYIKEYIEKERLENNLEEKSFKKLMNFAFLGRSIADNPNLKKLYKWHTLLEYKK